MKNFDLEFKLDELRKNDLCDLFDENGKRYTGVILSNRQAEEMLSIINDLEKEVLKLECVEIAKCCKTCDFGGIKYSGCEKCGNGRPMWKLNSLFEFLKPEIIDNKGFKDAVGPAIRYLFENHNPMTSIIIDYDIARLVTSEMNHNLTNEIPD